MANNFLKKMIGLFVKPKEELSKINEPLLTGHSSEVGILSDFDCDYIDVFNHEDGSVAVCFQIEDDKIMDIGDRMNEICEDAYMNGYNWTAFLNHYIAKTSPELLYGMDTDPEAGTYTAFYQDGRLYGKNAPKLASLIKDLVENEEALYAFLKENAENIEWE